MQRKLKPPLRWVGGQSRVATRILRYFPLHTTYIEPFCGSAAVFWAKPREWSAAEILNDIDGDLINFYKVLHRRGKRLAREVDSMPYSRRLFMHYLQSKPSTQFQRAVRFWYLNRVGFGGKRRHRSFGVQKTCTISVLPNCTLFCLDGVIERLRGVVFENLDFEHVTKLYDAPKTLFYIAPPYLGTFQGYASRFSKNDQERLAQILDRIRGCWLLSINRSSLAKCLYKNRHKMTLKTRYTIGCNSSTNAPSQAKELLVCNKLFEKRAM